MILGQPKQFLGFVNDVDARKKTLAGYSSTPYRERIQSASEHPETSVRSSYFPKAYLFD
jgi:hypothetical protein